MSVIWHDLECGAYRADLELWRELTERYGDPVLDVGAGTGRVTLELARLGHTVVALDRDPRLLDELERRAAGLAVETVAGDARGFDLGRRFPLIIVPMQTIQLLEGAGGRRRFLTRAARHLEPEGAVAVAITETLEHYSAEDGLPLPLPDVREVEGFVYSSQPTAVREQGENIILERLRETITPGGRRSAEHDAITLDRLTAGDLEREALAAGIRPAGVIEIPATGDHVGSRVVLLRG
jgi:SAM-dependent methyltransferase